MNRNEFNCFLSQHMSFWWIQSQSSKVCKKKKEILYYFYIWLHYCKLRISFSLSWAPDSVSIYRQCWLTKYEMLKSRDNTHVLVVITSEELTWQLIFTWEPHDMHATWINCFLCSQTVPGPGSGNWEFAGSFKHQTQHSAALHFLWLKCNLFPCVRRSMKHHNKRHQLQTVSLTIPATKEYSSRTKCVGCKLFPYKMSRK